MAETDMKPLSELDLYNQALDANSLLPMTVNISNSNVTRKVYFPAIKIQIAGYELVGTLTAGSTSITLSSAGTTYNQQTPYAVGDKITYTGDDEITRNYICVKAISATTGRNWNTDAPNFAEYTPLGSDSTVDIFTSVFGVNPTEVSVSNSAITLTFPSQSSDSSVQVRVT